MDKGALEMGKDPAELRFKNFIDFSATNGSQFFIAMQQPRFLDFKHTIFGQCVRGFDLLDKINAVPVTAQFANPRDTGAALENSRPTVEVQITSATVQPARSEAILLLSATDTVAATLVVTATDPAGGKSTRSVPVRGFRDLTNDPPLIRPIPSLVSAVGVAPPLPVRAFDLERDYLLYGFASVLVTSGTQSELKTDPGAFGTARIIAPPDSFTARTTAGFQDVALGVTAFNEPLLNAQASLDNPFAPFDAYHFQKIEIGFGDRAVSEEAFPVEGEAGAVLTDVILAEFRDGDAAGSAADFAANVHWGDGSLKDVSTATTPKIRIERSTTAPGAYVVKGTHTFAKPGVYPIETVLDGRLGATSRARSQAVIALPGTPLRAVGVSVVNTGATLADRVLAKFTDTTPGVQARNFSALVDWGDGAVSPGTIVSKGAGRFAVTGRHVYRDPEAFAVFVHVSRGTAAKAVAWSRVQVSGFAAPQHLPPFQMAHLVSQISQVNGFPFLTTTGTGANVQSRFALSIVVLNSGSIASQPGKLRFYLSKNQTFNAAAIGADPADVPMMLGPFSEADLPALPAGSGLRYDLIPTTSNGTPLDLRLVAPRGRAVASYFVLAHLGYSDPIADKMPIPKDVTFPRIDGIKLNKGLLRVTEAAGATHTGTFTVVIEGPPAADVKIKVALSNTQVTTDQTELIFTSVNWATPQTVTVTAVDDTNKESTTTTIITVGPSESTDASWDAMPGGTVAASVIDND